MEILEMFPRVFCFLKLSINENGDICHHLFQNKVNIQDVNFEWSFSKGKDIRKTLIRAGLFESRLMLTQD